MTQSFFHFYPKNLQKSTFFCQKFVHVLLANIPTKSQKKKELVPRGGLCRRVGKIGRLAVCQPVFPWVFGRIFLVHAPMQLPFSVSTIYLAF
jgi:hypothetical protein